MLEGASAGSEDNEIVRAYAVKTLSRDAHARKLDELAFAVDFCSLSFRPLSWPE